MSPRMGSNQKIKKEILSPSSQASLDAPQIKTRLRQTGKRNKKRAVLTEQETRKSVEIATRAAEDVLSKINKELANDEELVTVD